MLVKNKTSRKEQIELKAMDLFKSRGFTATSMRDLANALGMEAASLYSHIRSKEEILQKICFKIARTFFEALHKIEEGPFSNAEKLKKAIVAHVQVVTNNTSASAVFFNEWRHLSEPFLSDFLQMRHDYEQHFMAIIKDGIKAGEFEETDTKFTTLTLLSSLNWVHNWYKPSGKMTPNEIGHQLANLLINGLKNSPGVNRELNTK